MENNIVVRPYPREALHWFSKYIFIKDSYILLSSIEKAITGIHEW